ncbi:putative Cbp-p300-interacting transactivator 2-like protein, partial [Naja naja]
MPGEWQAGRQGSKDPSPATAAFISRSRDACV